MADAARVARWSGTVGGVLPAITLSVSPIWSYPGTQTAGTDVAMWALTHHDRLVVTEVPDTVGVTVWFVLCAAVWTYLHDRLPARSMVPTCFVAGFVGCVTLLLGGFTAFDLLLYRTHAADRTEWTHLSVDEVGVSDTPPLPTRLMSTGELDEAVDLGTRNAGAEITVRLMRFQRMRRSPNRRQSTIGPSSRAGMWPRLAACGPSTDSRAAPPRQGPARLQYACADIVDFLGGQNRDNPAPILLRQAGFYGFCGTPIAS
ncbi:hypothetical protein [Mycolicibacterium sediminis]|uniref:Uncharacterized protein n=1 Tax=Mycolicibacterium sediminis TaxID=1286180 RepID=A0A7I7QMM8_9MYCO|nr:hypothetical protein MSEDJ_12120 [Mycolicibacterium sediminis]